MKYYCGRAPMELRRAGRSPLRTKIMRALLRLEALILHIKRRYIRAREERPISINCPPSENPRP